MLTDPRETPTRTVDELIKIARLLSTEHDLGRLLNLILSSARKLTWSEAGRVYILDDTMRHLIPRVSQNDRVGEDRVAMPAVSLTVDDRRRSDHICAHCAFTGKLVKVDDVARYSGFDFTDLRDYDRVHGYHSRSVIVVPLRDHEQRSIGVLQLLNVRDPDTGRVRAFPSELESVINAFASQAAVALNNARLIDENHRLIGILDRSNKALEAENRALRERIERRDDYGDLVGGSPAMREVLDLVGKVANADATVLIRGETGTGKELIARAIHANGHRRRGEFVAQNCAALPEHLLESELFGYRKGAFTGANQDKKGLIELADGGTLFLDEIGDFPLVLQPKLLRVLQESEVRPLGGTTSRKLDTRVVAATHQDLRAKVANGEFREDLFYRLNVFPIDVPALRERAEDIPPLVDHFLGGKRRISPAAVECLSRYSFPGNVRELENLLERAALLCEPDGSIVPEHLPEEVRRASSLPSTATPGATPCVNTGEPLDLRAAVGDYEASLIVGQLDAVNWNQSEAARWLGIARRTLIEKMRKYDIQRGVLRS